MADIRILHVGDDVAPPSGAAPCDDGGDGWWSGFSQSLGQALVASALAASVALAQSAAQPFGQDDPAGSLFAAPEQYDYTPSVVTDSTRLVIAIDQDDPAGSLYAAQEDTWTSPAVVTPIPPQWVGPFDQDDKPTPPTHMLDDGEPFIVPARPTPLDPCSFDPWRWETTEPAALHVVDEDVAYTPWAPIMPSWVSPPIADGDELTPPIAGEFSDSWTVVDAPRSYVPSLVVAIDSDDRPTPPIPFVDDVTQLPELRIDVQCVVVPESWRTDSAEPAILYVPQDVDGWTSLGSRSWDPVALPLWAQRTPYPPALATDDEWVPPVTPIISIIQLRAVDASRPQALVRDTSIHELGARDRSRSEGSARGGESR